MEITVGEYGKMLFEIILSDKHADMPAHWQSIAAEAKPLLKQLLSLNDKMTGGGYTIVGHSINGQKVLSQEERIEKTQQKLWGVKAKSLKVGDRIFRYGEDISFDRCPHEVRDISRRLKCVYLDVQHRNGSHVETIDFDLDVIRLPVDFDENELYFSSNFWLNKAEEFGF